MNFINIFKKRRTLNYELKWYELDQCIVVGDIDFFYLKDEFNFADYMEKENYEVKAEIVSIKHSQLGKIRGIITIGLSYTIYLWDGRVLYIDAEERPGMLENYSLDINDWNFDIEINIIEKTGLTLHERLSKMSMTNKRTIHKQNIEKYKSLLGVTYADWETN